MGLIILFQRVCLHGTGLIHHVYFPGNKILIIIVTIINVDLYSSEEPARRNPHSGGDGRFPTLATTTNSVSTPPCLLTEVHGVNQGQTFRPGRRLEVSCPLFACRTSRASSLTFAKSAAIAVQLLCSIAPPIGDHLV